MSTPPGQQLEQPIVPIESDPTPTPPSTPLETDSNASVLAEPRKASLDLVEPVLDILTRPDL